MKSLRLQLTMLRKIFTWCVAWTTESRTLLLHVYCGAVVLAICTSFMVEHCWVGDRKGIRPVNVKKILHQQFLKVISLGDLGELA